ncbi:MAG: hypothetical protein K9N47_20735 [Prosthecobacter sp.]|uniref:hypothetical protein n=1 Tax=Prosthecobacter sp. TaxID=1965333 RepID=UPI002614D73F|nr:hypothetical protein [Prosthecobacter sp.]MCF7788561.1 hypothetical protein [Prosthecobacter sp.]
MRAPRRETPTTHPEKAPADSAPAIRTEGELKKLIAGKGKADTAQTAAVLARVSIVMADYLESGKPIGIALNPVEILSAIWAAIKEAEGQPSPWPDGADARAFFIHGLYDEIIQQPSNIFETKLFPDCTERYIPLDKATWKACLQRLHEQIIASGTKIGERKKRGG